MSQRFYQRRRACSPVTLCVALALIAVAVHPRGATAQAQRPAPCASESFQAFDYWIGEWVVRNADGDVVGSSRVSSRSSGCAVLEEWTAAKGPTGTSLNYYDVSDQRWHQEWVGGGGQILHLTGTAEDGVMTLGGDRETPRGSVRDRIRWIPLDDGRIEQRWDISVDGGKNWQVAFQGYYERRPQSG